MKTTKTGTCGDQIERGGVAWRKIMRMSCMERYESLYNFIKCEIQ